VLTLPGGPQTFCKYVRIACLCVELLLQSEAGEEFLKQHGLVRKVAELFRDELDGVPSPLSSLHRPLRIDWPRAST
jgi:hypothetical protein